MLGSKLKVVLVSVLATLALLIVVLKFSYSAIFSGLGLSVVDTTMLSKLKRSQRVVSQIQARNQNKRARAHKRFLKRTGKKLVVGSAAALTLGTTAVVLTTIGLEVEDYCDYLEDLEQERAILNAEQPRFDPLACAEMAKNDMDALAEHASSEGKQLLMDALGLE